MDTFIRMDALLEKFNAFKTKLNTFEIKKGHFYIELKLSEKEKCCLRKI